MNLKRIEDRKKEFKENLKINRLNLSRGMIFQAKVITTKEDL